ncbi:amidase domain-containing protein [Paenibacillus soyae]|uniref:Amidase domain-containing protein n=1 Tax=Paenibacillus soyae TaxID=2969249 RepID=A0A9X2MVJ4_9BACL|nr:amidase domain-containing protein [Paenibacillus soyae]MCR2807122.1 amidase domain-containing protein [Paenibacillus soyae]
MKMKKKFAVNLLVTGLLLASVVPATSAADNATSTQLGSSNQAAEKVETFQASDIRFLKTLPDGKDKAKSKAAIEHKDAIKLVTDSMKKKGVVIKYDLDDKEYQQYVLSLATDFDVFEEGDMKKIVEFVKFIDLYENYAVNEVLAGYQNKLKQRSSLTTDDMREVLSLMPIAEDEPSTLDTTVSLQGTSSVAPMTVFPNGYDNIAARDYAYEWWDTRNPIYSTYYAEKHDPACEPEDECWNDCTNFVSQALLAGGMEEVYGINYQHYSSWHFGGLIPSFPWGGAHNFYLHWKNRAGVATAASNLQTGDAVNADFSGDGTIDHTAIITKNTGSSTANKYLTQHTSDKKETTTLSTWYSAGYKVYGYEMDLVDQ